jgi:transposase
MRDRCTQGDGGGVHHGNRDQERDQDLHDYDERSPSVSKAGSETTLITHVAMESTGVYWKPVFNILEDAFEVILVNARHVKNVPGRKTDVKDAEWLLRSGLVRGSFIPLKEVRELTRPHPVQEEAHPDDQLRETTSGEDPGRREHQALLRRLRHVRCTRVRGSSRNSRKAS